MTFHTALFFCSHYAVISIFAVISYGIGRRLSRRVSYDNAYEEFAFCTSIGLGVISCLVFLLGLLHVLYRAVLLVLFLVIVLACKSVWTSTSRNLIIRWKASRNKPVVVAMGFVLVTFLLPAFVLCLYPPSQSDATSYHLAAAKIYAQAHALIYTPYLRFPVFPQFNEMLFTLMLEVSDDLAAQMVHLLMAVLTAIALYGWGRRVRNRYVGVLAAALWLFNPEVIWLASSAYIDLGLALFTCLGFYAFFNWFNESSGEWLAISGVMFGYAAASKYLALIPIIFCFLVLCYLGFRQHKWRAVAIFSVTVGFIAAPWYLRSFYYTGNPVWPYFGRIFGYGPWSRADYLGQLQEQVSYGIGKSLRALMLLPWNLAFNAKVFHQANDPYSPIYLFLLPLTVIVALRDKYVSALLLVTSLYTLFWFSTVEVGRYLLIVVPLLSLASAMALGRCLSYLPLLASARRMAIATSVMLLVIVVVTWPQIIKILPTHAPPTTKEARGNYLDEMLPDYPIFDFLNRQRGSEYSVYALGGSNMAYFSDGRFMGDWFGPARYGRILSVDSEPQTLYTVLKDLGAEYFVVDLDSFPLEQLLQFSFLTDSTNHLKLIDAMPRTLLFEVIDRPSPCTIGPELLRNSGFESVSNGKPDYWTLNGNPRLDTSAHYSHNGSTAVASQGEDSFTQRVTIRPGHLYVLSHFMRVADDAGVTGFARLQINWIGGNPDRVVGVAIRGVTETSQWEQHHMAVAAPPNASSADVYASVSGARTAWFDDFSLTELVCR